jgi:hypothetical protein
MSISEFTKALEKRANGTLNAQASKILEELLRGSTDLFDPKNPLSIQSGASLLSKGTMEKPDTTSKTQEKYREVNLSESFRLAGESQGRTALVLTASDLDRIFKNLNVTNTTGKSPIQLYINFLIANFGSSYKAKHFEFYVQDSNTGKIVQDTTNYGNKRLSSVFAKVGDDYQLTTTTDKIRSFRGLNFSHANALTHLSSFLVYQETGTVHKTGPAIKEMSERIGRYFQRGHVIAQTTGRGQISAQYVTPIKDSNGKEINPVLLLIELSRKLDTVSSGLEGSDHALLANIEKDFNAKSPRMNIQFQPLFDDSGLGNQQTGRLSTSIALVTTLQRLLNITLTQTRAQKKAGTVSVGQASVKSLDNFAKVLRDFLVKLEKDDSRIYKGLSAVLNPDGKDTFLIDLKSSDTLRDYIDESFNTTFSTGKPAKNLSIKSPKVPVVRSKTKKPNLPKLSNTFVKLKTELEKQSVAKKAIKLVRDSQLPPKTENLLNLSMLMMQINSSLHDQIKKNMGTGGRRDVLNYRSGRLAESAKVERLSQSREGMITAFYSYMKNPYATFSRGGRQDRPYTRDPKLLISKSIRELAGTQVANRMRAVLV